MALVVQSFLTSFLSMLFKVLSQLALVLAASCGSVLPRDLEGPSVAPVSGAVVSVPVDGAVVASVGVPAGVKAFPAGVPVPALGADGIIPSSYSLYAPYVTPLPTVIAGVPTVVYGLDADCLARLNPGINVVPAPGNVAVPAVVGSPATAGGLVAGSFAAPSLSWWQTSVLPLFSWMSASNPALATQLMNSGILSIYAALPISGAEPYCNPLSSGSFFCVDSVGFLCGLNGQAYFAFNCLQRNVDNYNRTLETTTCSVVDLGLASGGLRQQSAQCV